MLDNKSARLPESFQYNKDSLRVKS